MSDFYRNRPPTNGLFNDPAFLLNEDLHLMDQSGRMYDNMLDEWSKYITEFRNTGPFPMRQLNRDVDATYARGMASLPSVSGALKGMGVDAAEGQAAMMASLPAMQARSEGRAQNLRDNYSAQMAKMTQLGNIYSLGQQLRQSGLDRRFGWRQHMVNKDLNE